MNSVRSSRGAFTLIEMLCVIAIVGILAALLLPALSQGKARARRVECLNNLREIGVGFHGFMHDHNGRFPMEVPALEGGSLEFVQSGYQLGGNFYFAFRHFVPLASELGTPKILVCPSDTRRAATNFAALRNKNLGYFAGVAAQFSKPESILAGDRNVTNDWAQSGTLLHAATSPLRWTQELHRFRGNLLFADGHIEEKNDVHLVLAYKQREEVQDFVLPTVPRAAVPASVVTPARTRDHAPEISNAGRAAASSNRQTGGFASIPSGGSGAHSSYSAVVPPTSAPEKAQSNATVAARPSPQAGTTPQVASTESPFVQGFVASARGLVRTGAWFLWLLLLLIAAILLTLCARGRSHVRRR